MKSILIIDDEDIVRDAIREILLLEWPDLTIYEAANGAIGIETAVLSQPNLIILDGNMPILTGFQMVLLLREMKTVAHIPIIAITASSTLNAAVRLMIESSNAYVPKPFDVSVLLTAVSQFLQ